MPSPWRRLRADEGSKTKWDATEGTFEYVVVVTRTVAVGAFGTTSGHSKWLKD